MRAVSGGTLADLLRAEGLAVEPAQASDAAGPVRTNSVPTVAEGRDRVGTLEASNINVSRPSRLSRPENTGSEGGMRAQASSTGAGVAGAAESSSARLRAAERLRRAAEAEGLDPGPVLARDDAEPVELLGMTAAGLRAYALALAWSSEIEAGRVPEGWTVRAECSGCGSVLLPAGMPDRVRACRWCESRRAGRVLPGVPARG